MADDIFSENILDHFKDPRNRGALKNPDIKHKEFNPFCGDQIEVTIRLSGGKIADIMFDGKGCSISQASMSMLTETVKGKTLKEVDAITKEDILDMLGIPIGPVRLKCALLGLDTIKNGLLIHEKYKKSNGR